MEAVENISVGLETGTAGRERASAKKGKTGSKVSVREKVCYGVGDIGANLVWTTVASFLTILHRCCRDCGRGSRDADVDRPSV